jgi:predicted aldo/keto reductase-like oxidoreductase
MAKNNFSSKSQRKNRAISAQGVSRRTFIRNTSLATAGAITGVLTGQGCTISDNTKLSETAKLDTSKILNYNSSMGYRRLGKTNLVISEIVLGAHFNNPKEKHKHFWDKFANDELPVEVAKNRTEVVSRCIDHGINFLDITYGGEALAYGAALKGRREKIYVAADDGEFCMRHKSRRNAASQMQSIESCLRRLNTDYLDIWRPQFQHMDGHPDSEMEMCIEVFEKVHKQGKARFLGMSTHDRVWTQKVIEKFPQYAMVYMPYTLKSKVKQSDPKSIDRKLLYEPGEQHWWLKDTRKGLFVIAKSNDVGVITIKPFSAGLIFSTSRQDFGKQCTSTPEDYELARLTLSYILSNPDISAVAVGMTLLSEVDNDVRASFERHTQLDDRDTKVLRKAAERMWVNLPDDYHWLKNWEWV